MTIKTSKGKQALFTEINITPLTDIFLVLLIIMMVIAPTFQSMDNQITVPEINSGLSIEQKDATVSVAKDGAMYINGKKIQKSELVDELVAIRDSLEKKQVVVKADKAVKSSEVMDIMNAAKEAEYEKLVLAGEPLSKKEQKELNKQNESSQTETINQVEQEDAPYGGSDWVE
ncbi:biopolymer transporter ExbD [bacterium]|nr:biopolymer transporter ExbD [bacterium]